MPSTVQQLIDGRQELVTISREGTAQQALELMIEHDYSQLPIVEEDSRRVVGDKENRAGMVTNDSILSAIVNFGVPVQELRIADVMVQTSTFRMEDDLFDLLEDLRDNPAVLIVDGERNLSGIITNFDTTAYFRRRAEDIMLVEDIENTIKDYILAYFTNDRGEVNQTELQAAIEAILPTYNKFNNPFRQALMHYLVLNGLDQQQLNEDNAQKAFTEFFKEQAKPFDELSLGQYIDLFTSKPRWKRYKEIFKLEREAIGKLLDDVRKSRNGLMHFRDEISRKQRRQLRFCKEWLERHRTNLFDTFGITATEPKILPATALRDISTRFNLVDESLIQNQNEGVSTAEEFAPVDEVLGPDDSRYALLALWLQQYPLDQQKVSLSFEEIEEIIRDKLPLSARKHRAWWSNHLEFSPQARQWWEAGWRVSTVRMMEETVTFARIEGRKRAYIDFFSSLLAQLSTLNPFPMRNPSPDGENWVTIAGLPKDRLKVASLAFSFARKKRFRVELYIDTGNEQKNKSIFDSLYVQKNAIETELGEPLNWERLDDGKTRASRIALYHVGSITDEDSLIGLREWAVEAMIRFYRVIEPKLTEVCNMLQEVLEL